MSPANGGAALSTAEMARRYEGGESLRRIGAVAGVSAGAVRQRLLRAGVVMRPAARRAPAPPDLPELAARYEQGTSLTVLASEAGLAFGTLRRQLAEAGVAQRGRRSVVPRVLRGEEAERVVARYAAGESVYALARTYRVHERRVRQLLAAHGLRLRGPAEARRRAGG